MTMDTNTPSTAMITQLEQDWCAAIVSNDADRISRFMSDDWVIIGTEGISNKEAFLELIRSGKLTHHTMDFEHLRVRLYNDTFIISSRGTSAGHFDGQPFSFFEWSTDVFIMENGKWKAVLTQLIPAVDAN